MKLNWNFLGEKGMQNKKSSVREYLYGYFLELHISKIFPGADFLVSNFFLSYSKIPHTL